MSPLRARRFEADVFHLVEPSSAHLARWALAGPTVISVHDLVVLRAARGDIPWSGKRWWIWRYRWGTRQLRHADALVCPSRTTQRDLRELCEVDPDRVHYVPLAVAERFRPLDWEERQRARAALRRGRERVVMHVDTGGYYKNVPAILRTLASLRRQGVEAALVRVGVRMRHEDRALASDLGVLAHVRDLGVVGDEELVRIYNGADALLFPSYYEGFGWPPLEAMACGTPVVCSNAPALAELVGDAAITAGPEDISALSAALGEVLTKRGLAERQTRRGLSRASAFSLDRTLDGYERLYARLAGGR
jgi:glycosyltransferase involved in cell wall biosynthesis